MAGKSETFKFFYFLYIIMIKEVYCRYSEKADLKNKDKKIISDDAYIIAELLEKILNSMRSKK